MAGNDRRRGRIPLGLIGALAMVIAVEAQVGRHGLEFAATGALDWRTARTAAARQATKADVLCFGDSLVKFGVQPRILEARTGRPSFNLALFGGPIPASHALLRRTLHHGARPTAIVVDFERNKLVTAPGNEATPYPWAEVLGFRDAIEMALENGDTGLFARYLAERALPTIRWRLGVREAIVAAFDGTTPETRASKTILQRNWRRNRGAVVNASNGRSEGVAVAEGAERALNHWRPHPINVRYLRRFLDLATLHGIRVVWLMPPFSPELQAMTDRSQDEARYEAFVRSILAEHPEVLLLDARHAGYPIGVFTDPAHLDRQGATVLSEELAHWIGPGAGPIPDSRPTPPRRHGPHFRLISRGPTSRSSKMSFNRRWPWMRVATRFVVDDLADGSIWPFPIRGT